jgi:hypothetical protein
MINRAAAVLMVCLAVGGSPAMGQEKKGLSSVSCQSCKHPAKQQTNSDKGSGQGSALSQLLTKTANGTYDPYHGKSPARQGEAGGTLAFILPQRSWVQSVHRTSTSWRPRFTGRYHPQPTSTLGNESWIYSPQPTQTIITMP